MFVAPFIFKSYTKPFLELPPVINGDGDKSNGGEGLVRGGVDTGEGLARGGVDTGELLFGRVTVFAITIITKNPSIIPNKNPTTYFQLSGSTITY